METLISIIIPTYNRSNFIGETLDSILAQNYKNWECIIVDDASTDYTDELLDFYCKKDSRIQYFHRPLELKKGANSCRNYGFSRSRGKYVKWFDSDDVMHISYLKHNIETLNSKVPPDLLITNFEHFSDDKLIPKKNIINRTAQEKLMVDYLKGKVLINTQVTLWRRNILNKYQFDESLSRAQELDFHFKILREENLKIVFIDKILVSIRDHNDSITGKYNKGGISYLSSELRVRRRIIKYLLVSGIPNNQKRECFRLYLVAFSKLYKFNPISEVFKELELLEITFGNKKFPFVWKCFLLQFLLIYKITGRTFRLENHLKTLENFFVTDFIDR